jgi:hypothetical protein
MRSSGMHVWQLHIEPLTADNIVGLFGEALNAEEPWS